MPAATPTTPAPTSAPTAVSRCATTRSRCRRTAARSACSSSTSSTSRTYAERADPEQARGLQTGLLRHRPPAGRTSTAGWWRSTSATRSWRCSARRWPPRTTRCAAYGPGWSCNAPRPVQPAGPHPPLRFRVGVATGEALVDLAAARDGGQAFVTGDVVNTASRLQSARAARRGAGRGSTWAATRREIRVRGPAAGHAARPVHREPDLAGRPGAAAGATGQTAELTPMVDRDHELGPAGQRPAPHADRAHPQLVTVFGPAGVGKSRLLRELSRHAASLPDDPVTWRTGRCPPFGENVTYAALADIVEVRAGIRRRRPGHRRDRLRERLGRLGRARTRDGWPTRCARWSALPGERLHPAETEAAWRRFLLALAAPASHGARLRGPALGRRGDAVLRRAARRGGPRRAAAAARTARPELRRAAPGLGRHDQRLDDHLAAADCTTPDIATLYAHLLGQAACPRDALTPLIEFADGNPLYAHEYAGCCSSRAALRRADRRAGRSSTRP